MSKPDHHFSSMGAAPADWLAQMTDPKAWQSMVNLAQAGMPSMSAMPAMPSMPAHPAMAALVPPEKLAALQKEFTESMSTLWADLLASRTPQIRDRRFSAPAWQSNPLYAFNAASYLLNARMMNALADAVEADAKTKQKIRFATQQAIDAMSPSNFLATNPEAQKKLIETKGESLTKGIMHMIADMRKGHISQTDETAFEVGVNVATSEGAVVFENTLIQVLQYRPLTKQVHERPLLIVPPCINKFYILDLQPENSLIRYAVEQGHTVFVVSWVNPNESHAQLGWDDYIQHGVIDAIEVAQDISGAKQINTLGFCVGGTLLATALSVLAARGKKPASSLTLLTTMLDFSDVGAIEVYVDETQVAQREQSIGQGGLMPGRDFAAAFSSLRPNDLVWKTRRRLICCTGMRTAPICPARCFAITCAICTSKIICATPVSCRWERMRLIWVGCRSRRFYMRRAKTISCPGPVLTRRPACLTVPSAAIIILCSARQATLPVSLIRLPRKSAATGRIKANCRIPPKPGWKAQRNIQAAGGPSGLPF